jgi:hypothetical protein
MTTWECSATRFLSNNFSKDIIILESINMNNKIKEKYLGEFYEEMQEKKNKNRC